MKNVHYIKFRNKKYVYCRAYQNHIHLHGFKLRILHVNNICKYCKFKLFHFVVAVGTGEEIFEIYNIMNLIFY